MFNSIFVKLDQSQKATKDGCVICFFGCRAIRIIKLTMDEHIIVNNMIYHGSLLLVSMFLMGAFCAVQFRSDLSKIQAKRIIAYQSTSALSTANSLDFSFTYYQSFVQIPTIFHTVCGLRMANTKTIEYNISLSSKTTSNVTFSLVIGPNTQTYYFSINTIALDFENFKVGTITLTSTTCVNRTLPSNCMESYILPYRSASSMLYSLTGVKMDNEFAAFPLALNTGYSVQVTRVEISNLSWLYSASSYTTKIYHFTYTYLMLAPASSNFSSTVQTYLQFNHGTVRNVVSPYSNGQFINNESAIIGIVGLNFESGSSLEFDLYFPNQFQAKATINMSATATEVSFLIVDYLVLGAPYCTSPSVLIYNTTAACAVCDLTTCLTCSVTLCATCPQERYLSILNITNGIYSGLCKCRPGYIEVNQICLPCNETCLECVGQVNNCTVCKYGYKLVRGYCVTVCYLMAPWKNCQQCPKGCSVCEDSGACLRTLCTGSKYYDEDKCLDACPTGNYANSQMMRCDRCSEGCLACIAYQNCSLCEDGMFLNQSGFCISCPNTCKTCTGLDSCTSCLQGVTTNGVCNQLCSSNCLVCVNFGCMKCEDNYLLQNGSCIECGKVFGFAFTNDTCLEICGDGVKVFAQCDDGNTVDGDGCSSKCEVETGFVCETNKESYAGDYCYKQGIKLIPTISRSLIQNKIQIQLVPNIGNLRTVQLQCKSPIEPYPQSNISIEVQRLQSDQVKINMQFYESVVRHNCKLSLTPKVQVNIRLETIPPAYLITFKQLTLEPLISFLKVLMALSLAVFLIFHGLTPWMTSTFMCNVALFFVSLLNCRGTPLIVYMLTPALNWINLTHNIPNSIADQEDSYSVTSVLKFEGLLPMSWPLWFLFAFMLVTLLGLKLMYKKLSKRIVLIMINPIRETLRFIHCSFMSYEPILLVRILLLAKNNTLQGSNLALVVVFFVFQVSSLIILCKILSDKGKVSIANDGPLMRLQILFYTMLTTKYCMTTHQIGPALAILLGFGVCTSRIYFLVKESLFKRKYEQLKSESVSSTDSEFYNNNTRFRFKEVRRRMHFVQQFCNEAFFVFNNLLVLYMCYRSDPSFQQELVVGIVKLTGFVIFVLTNLTIILWTGISKLKHISLLVGNKIYPAERSVAERQVSLFKDANEEWRNKIVNIKKGRKSSFSSELRATKATISSAVSGLTNR